MRAEERKEIPSGDDLDSNGQLPREFIKLGEDDMSEMAKYCREAGLEHMLFVCLKIFDKKISDNEAKETDAMANHPNAIHTRRFSHGALVQVITTIAGGTESRFKIYENPRDVRSSSGIFP